MDGEGLDQRIATHAIREKTVVATEVDAALEEIAVLGFAVLASGLDAVTLDAARSRVDEIYAQQVVEIGGEQNLRLINDGDVARGLCAYDDLFLSIAVTKVLREVCERLFGENFILMSQNGIINRPGGDHYQLTWHRDLNYQHYVSSRPLALSALLCLDPFSLQTGGTYVLPATHKVEAFPSEQFVRKHQRVVEAPPGSFILFDSMLFHRTGRNSSAITRRGVNHIITQPFLKQQYSFSAMCAGRVSDPFLRRFLGGGTETAPDVNTWRRAKLRQHTGEG